MVVIESIGKFDRAARSLLRFVRNGGVGGGEGRGIAGAYAVYQRRHPEAEGTEGTVNL